MRLFAYEAGAIHENQRNYDRAIREYAQGAIAQPGSNSEQRLLLLARRPALKPQIEQLTTSLVSDRNPQPGMFQLRVALLRNQNRRDDLEKFLLNAASRTTSLEVLTRIENTARVDGLPKAQQASIEKQIALMSDPVEKMRLRLALARVEEGQGRAAQGAAVVDALYRENPAILGVVRAAVDYHWRNKDSRRAVDILEEASSRASAAYRSPFLVEAARKATDSGDYARARIMVGYLQVFDQPYQGRIHRAQGGHLRAPGRRSRTAHLLRNDHPLSFWRDGHSRAAAYRTDRRYPASLIPVLTRVKDYSGGRRSVHRNPESFPRRRRSGARSRALRAAKRRRQKTARLLRQDRR